MIRFESQTILNCSGLFFRGLRHYRVHLAVLGISAIKVLNNLQRTYVFECCCYKNLNYFFFRGIMLFFPRLQMTR